MASTGPSNTPDPNPVECLQVALEPCMEQSAFSVSFIQRHIQQEGKKSQICVDWSETLYFASTSCWCCVLLLFCLSRMCRTAVKSLSQAFSSPAESVRSLSPELCSAERTPGQMQAIEMKWIYSKSAFLLLSLSFWEEEETRKRGEAKSSRSMMGLVPQPIERLQRHGWRGSGVVAHPCS